MTLYPVIVTVKESIKTSTGETVVEEVDHVAGYIPSGYSPVYAQLAAKALSTAVWLANKGLNRKVTTSWRWGTPVAIEV